MPNQIRTIDFLPEIFKTDVARQFLNSTLDQLTQQPNTVPIEGFIGSKFGYGIGKSDRYVTEYNKIRNDYQLEPAVVFTKESSTVAKDFINYNGIIDALRSNGSSVKNHNVLFGNEFYSWDSFVNLDKIVNFNQYRWLPYGPESVEVASSLYDLNVEFVITPTASGVSMTSDGDQLESLNPNLVVVRGGTYTFKIPHNSKFWIQGTTSTDGIIDNLDTRDVLGIVNNGATDNIITFNVPFKDAQDYLDYPIFMDVDLVSDLKFSQLNNRAISEIDGISDLDGKTLILRNETSSYTSKVYQIKLLDNPLNFLIPLVSLVEYATIPSNKLITCLSGEVYHARSFVRETGGKFSIIPFLSANIPTLYYYDEFNASNIGTITIIDDISQDVLNVEDEIIGKSSFISKNHVVFTNGLKVSFSGDVYPEKYKFNEYYVEGVGSSIKLIDTKSLAIIEGFARGGYNPYDVQAFDVESFDSTFTVAGTKDYITIARHSNDVNAWSRSNRWFHIDVLAATAKYNNTPSSIATLNDQSSKADRPIIEFYPDLQLFNSGSIGRGIVDFLISSETVSLLNVIDVNISRLNSGDDTVTVGNNSALTVGALFMLKNSSIGNISVGKKYYISGKIGTNKITIANVIGGRPIALTDWLPSIGENVTAESGNIYYGNKIDARTMISATKKCYFDINLDNPIDESKLVFDGMKVMFTDGIDLSDRNNVLVVRISEVSIGEKVITLSIDTTLNPSDSIVVNNGHVYAGKTVWNNGGNWTVAQQKTLVNQPPLFDVFDSNGKSFSLYPSSTFNGSTLFEYATGSGNDDSVLGFPIQYSNVSTIGDIVFDATYQSGKFVYNSNTEQQLISGTVKRGSEYLNGWKPAAAESIQYQTFEFSYNPSSGNNFSCDVAALNSVVSVWKPVQVYVDNVRINDDEFTITVTDKNTVVSLSIYPEAGAKIQVLINSADVSDKAYYAIPSNLSNNPFNDSLGTLSTSDIRSHYKSICNNYSKINGQPFGANNYRDVGDVVSYGTRLVQHSAPVTYTGAFMRGTHNFYSALEFNAGEYVKFKTTLLDIVTNSEFTRLDSFDEILSYALEEISTVKSESSSFFWSDMVPSKTPVSSKIYTVKNFVGTSVFPLSKVYDFKNANYNGVLVFLRKLIKGNISDILLIKGVDYTISEDKPTVTVTRDLVNGDSIVVNEYDQTYGSFVPNTPTKVGLYPAFVPTVIYDNTYSTPSYFIVGHDGSRSKLYGDYSSGQFTDLRDGVLLEFEKRIYNNLKTSNTLPLTRAEVIPGKFRDNGVSHKEFMDMYSVGFMNWVGKNRIDFKNQFYSVTNKFTWNYSETIGELDNAPLSQGSWRGLNLWFYDTVNPAKTPWEMLGYTTMPSWWSSRYGAAPYTSNNSVLWGDLERGYDWNGGTPIIKTEYARPSLSKIIPVDATGTLLSPDALLVGTYSPSHQFNRGWVVGDVGPSEYAYLNSSTWPFDLMRLYALSRPAKFFGLGIDLDSYKFNISKSQFVVGGVSRSTNLSYGNYGSGVASHSYTNWMIDYYHQFGISGSERVKSLLTNIDVRLAYRLAGFSDKDMLKFYVEKNSSNSKAKSLLIPDENYTVMLYDNVPSDTVVYSSVIIQKTEGGFAVWGNSQTKTYFTTYGPKISGKFKTISNAGIEVNLSLTHSNNVITIPYGTEFTSVQSLCEFIQNYGKFLESQGMIFDAIENGITVNWDRMINEVLYWVKSGWDIGSSINLNPCATQLKVNKDNLVVQPLTLQHTNYALNQNLTPIKIGDIHVTRNGSEFVMNTLNEGDTFAYTVLNLHTIEHAVLFDNYTQFNDVIYNLTTGLRQQRLIAKGIKTADWTGILDTGGFILNQDNVEEWNADTKYTYGTIVKYKNSFWIASDVIYPSSIFDENRWKQTNYDKIQKGLLPNAATRSHESSLFYDTRRANLESDNNVLGFSLIGFRPRQYMNDADLSDVSQVNVFKEMLPLKGTSLATSTFKNASLLRGDIDYDIHENWAIKNSDFGNVLNSNFVEFKLGRAELSGNPSTISMYDGADVESTDYIIPLSNIINYGYPVTTKDIIPTVTGITNAPFIDAGYVNKNTVSTYAYNFGGLNTAQVKPSSVYGGSAIWLADHNGSWNIYTPTSLGILTNKETALTAVINNYDGFVTLVFSSHHGLVKNDSILVTNFSDSFGGFFEITDVIDLFSVTVAFNMNNTKSFTGKGVVFKLSSMRVETEDSIKDLYMPSRVWVDTSSSEDWAVYTKSKNIVKTDTLNGNYSALAVSKSMGYITSLDGVVNRYIRDYRTNELVLIDQLSGGISFGNSIVSAEPNILVISEPTDMSLHVFNVNFSSSVNKAVLNQTISAPFGSTQWGSIVTLSGDGQWMYVSATGDDWKRVYAFAKAPHSKRTNSTYVTRNIVLAGASSFNVTGDRTNTFASGVMVSFTENKEYTVLLSVYNPITNVTTVSIDRDSESMAAGSPIFINTIEYTEAGHVDSGTVVSISTNYDGTVLVVGDSTYDFDITFSNTGQVKVYERSAQKYESTGSSPLQITLAHSPDFALVSINGIALRDTEYTINGNQLTITYEQLMVGDLIELSDNRIVHTQTLLPFTDINSASVGVQYGKSVSVNSSGSELIVGAPGSMSVDGYTGAAFRYTNNGRASSSITFTPRGTVETTAFINGYAISLPIGPVSDIADEINRQKLHNIVANVIDGSIVLTQRDSSIGPNKLTLVGVTPDDSIELGLQPYVSSQIIYCPFKDNVTKFGDTVVFNRGNSFAISAPELNGYEITTFDNNTVFDNNGTMFYHSANNTGMVFIYDHIPSFNTNGTYVEGQRITNLDQTKFGKIMSFNDADLLVGSESIVEIYDTGDSKNWVVEETAGKVADISKIKTISLYNSVDNATLEELDHIDPNQGKLLNAVHTNIDIISPYDPAGYNNGSNTSIVWSDDYIGRMWFDTTNVRFSNNYHSDISTISSQWGKPFEASDVAVYTWISSSVPPDQYIGNGSVKSLTDFSSSLKVSSDGRLVTLYYFWVRNTNKVFSNIGKTLSDSTLESYIKNPSSSGIPYFAAYRPDVFGLYNVAEYVNGEDTALHIGFSNGESGESNSEFSLIRTNFAEDFLEGVPKKVNEYAAPYGLYEHFLNSISGTDRFGNAIPDPALPGRVRYGVAVNPRQSMFVNNRVALRNLVNYANDVMETYPIIETRRPSLLFSENTQNYWSLVNWWEEGFNESTKASVQVEKYYDLFKLLPKEKMIAAVTANSDGQREVYQYRGGSWVRIGLFNGTIKIDSSIYEYTGFGDDLADTSFDSFPTNEIKNVVRSLIEEIFIDDLLIHRNKALITLFEYIQSESLITHNYMSWLTKTSFIDVSHDVGKLDASTKYKGDSVTLLEGYLSEVTPYHVVFKDFLYTYSSEEVYASTSTDFDLPALYQSETARFVTPQLVYSGEDITNEDQFLDTDLIWNNPSFNDWASNYGIKLGGLNDYPCAESVEYISAKSTTIKVNNASGFPVTGLIRLDDEFMFYNGVDVINNVILNVSRGANGSQIVPHFPTQMYITTSGVIVLHGGRGYSSAPKVTAAYNDGDYHPLPTKPTVFRASMIGDSVGSVKIISDGDGYYTQPKINIEPAFTINFSSDAVNTGNHTLTLSSISPLETYDTVKYIATPNNSIVGLIRNQYYYVRVFNTIVANGIYTQQISLYSEYHHVVNDVHPVELLSKGGDVQSLAQGAIAYAIGSTSPIRQNITTLRFDRTSYTPTVTAWKSGDFYAGQIQENNMFSSSGRSLYDTVTFPFVSATGGSGTGAEFTVNHLTTGSVYLADYEVLFTNSGTGYRVGDILVVPGVQFGGISTRNDLTIYITDITVIDQNAVSGSILKYDVTGIAPFDYSLGIESNSYSGISPLNDNGTGIGAVIDVISRSKVVPLSNTYSLGSSYNGGEGYSVGDILTISGTALNGVEPDNNAIITVESVINVGTLTGVIKSASVNGTGYIDIRASSQFGVLPITAVTVSDGETRLELDYTASGLHPAQLSGQRVALHKSPMAFMNVPHTLSGGGSGARFNITTPRFNADNVTAEYSVTVAQTGAIPAVGSGYKTGDILRIDGTLLGGSTPANDAFVVVEYVDGIMGRIEEVSVYGKAINPVEYYYVKSIDETVVELYGNSTLTKKISNIDFVAGDFAYIPKLGDYSTSMAVYNNVVYKCLTSNNDVEFDFGKWTPINSDDRSLNALDRIAAYYKPTPDMPSNDISMLVDGVTYPNAVYKGADFKSITDVDSIIKNLPFISEVSIKAITSYNGKLYAIGETTTATLLLTSSDRINWDTRIIVGEPLNSTDLTVVNGTFILSASNSTTPMMISYDGSKWISGGKSSGYDVDGYDNDQFDDSNVDVSSTYINTITKNTDKFVIGGNNISTSNDGVHWTEVFSFTDSVVNGLSNTINSIAYGNISQFSGYIAVGGGNAYRQDLISGEYSLVYVPRIIMSNSDAWTEIVPSGIPDIELTTVVIGDDSIIATSADNQIYKSRNGMSWSSVGTTNNGINSAIYTDGKFILVGNSGEMTTSVDGNSWIHIDLSSVTGDNLNAITWDNGEFLVVGDNSVIIKSIDGISWINISEINQRNVDYNIVGDAFDAGYAPGEMVAGVVSDSIAIRVDSTPGGDWGGMQSVYFNNGFKITRSQFEVNSELKVHYGSLISNPTLVAAYIYNIDNGLGRRIYEITPTISNPVVITNNDWVNSILTLNDSLELNEILVVESYEPGGGNILMRTSSKEIPILIDEASGNSCMYIPFSSLNFIDIIHPLYINGVEQVYGTDYTVSGVQSGNIKVQFSRILDVTFEYVSITLMNTPTPENMIFRSSGEFTQTFDLGDPLTQYLNTDSGIVQIKSAVTNDWIPVSPLNWSTDGVRVQVADEQLLQETDVRISLINDGMPSKYTVVYNGSNITLPTSIGIFASTDSLVVKINDIKTNNFTVDIQTYEVIVPDAVIGDIVTIWLKTYTLPEDTIFEPEIGSTEFILSKRLGSVNINNAIVSKNGSRLVAGTDYVLDALLLTLVSPSADGDVYCVTSFDNTRNQYYSTQTFTNARVSEVLNIDSSNPAVLTTLSEHGVALGTFSDMYISSDTVGHYGNTSYRCKAISSTTLELYDINGLPVDGSIYSRVGNSYISKIDQFHLNQEFRISDIGRVWVYLNGQRIIHDNCSIIDFNNLILRCAVTPSDVIVVTTMTPTATPDHLTYCIVIDKNSNPVVHRRSSHSAWLSDDVTPSSDTIIVDDVTKLLHNEVQRCTVAFVDGKLIANIVGDRRAVCGVRVFNESSRLEVPSSSFKLILDKLSPILVFNDGVNQNDKLRVTVSMGNTICISGEYIRFNKVDYVNNSVTGLTRGSRGSAIRPLHAKYSYVDSVSFKDELPKFYYNKVWTNNENTSLQTSTTFPALFLNSRE